MKKKDINLYTSPLTFIQSLHLVTVLSIRWSTTAELSNRHSSCRVDFSSTECLEVGNVKVQHGREHPKDFQWDH